MIKVSKIVMLVTNPVIERHQVEWALFHFMSGSSLSSNSQFQMLSLSLKGTRRPLSEADWSKEDLKDPKKGAEMTALLEGQENFVGSLLDSAWEREWREQQVGMVVHMAT